MELRWIPALLLLAVTITPNTGAIHDLLPCEDIPETCDTQDFLIDVAVRTYEYCEKTAEKVDRSCDVNGVVHAHVDGNIHIHD